MSKPEKPAAVEKPAEKPPESKPAAAEKPARLKLLPCMPALYRMEDLDGKERLVPAIITRVHNETCVNLTAFPELCDDPSPALRKSGVLLGTGVGEFRSPLEREGF